MEIVPPERLYTPVPDSPMVNSAVVANDPPVWSMTVEVFATRAIVPQPVTDTTSPSPTTKCVGVVRFAPIAKYEGENAPSATERSVTVFATVTGAATMVFSPFLFAAHTAAPAAPELTTLALPALVSRSTFRS